MSVCCVADFMPAKLLSFLQDSLCNDSMESCVFVLAFLGVAISTRYVKLRHCLHTVIHPDAM